NGNIYDGNTIQHRDERTYQALLHGVWADLQLTNGTGAANKIADTISSYIAEKAQEYHTYWSDRNQQPDPTTFDPNFVVALSSAEQDFYQDYYQKQGIANGLSGAALTSYVNNAIQTLVSSRTAQYQALNSQFVTYFLGLNKPFPTSYDPKFTYVASAA